jgi:hypothetical protein
MIRKVSPAKPSAEFRYFAMPLAGGQRKSAKNLSISAAVIVRQVFGWVHRDSFARPSGLTKHNTQFRNGQGI